MINALLVGALTPDQELNKSSPFVYAFHQSISVDHAVLTAGPMAKLVETLAIKAGIDFERGWDQEPKLVTMEKIRGMRGGQEEAAAEEPLILSSEEMPEDAPEEEGLMSMQGAANEDAQQEMLGNI